MGVARVSRAKTVRRLSQGGPKGVSVEQACTSIAAALLHSPLFLPLASSLDEVNAVWRIVNIILVGVWSKQQIGYESGFNKK